MSDVRKIWVRVGMMIEVDSDKLMSLENDIADAEMVRAIRDGYLDGETYIPEVDCFDGLDVLDELDGKEFLLDGKLFEGEVK